MKTIIQSLDDFNIVLIEFIKISKLPGTFNNLGLAKRFLNSLVKDEYSKILMNKLRYDNDIVFIYDALISALFSNPYALYNSWNTKIFKSYIYVSDELFMYVLDNKEELLDILYNMNTLYLKTIL